MSARRIAPSLFPLCTLIALAACASVPPNASAPVSSPIAAPTSAPPGTSSGPGAVGGAVLAQAKTRRLSANELQGTWALRTATDGAGARIEALFPEMPAEAMRTPQDGVAGVSLVFDTDGGASAYAGCNRIRGSYQTTRDSLTLDLSIMTKMGCPDPLNHADAALSQGLSGRFRAVLLEGMPLQLRLTAEDGSVYLFNQLPMQL